MAQNGKRSTLERNQEQTKKSILYKPAEGGGWDKD